MTQCEVGRPYWELEGASSGDERTRNADPLLARPEPPQNTNQQKRSSCLLRPISGVTQGAVEFCWIPLVLLPHDPNGLATGHARCVVALDRVSRSLMRPGFGPGLTLGQSFATQLLVESAVDFRNESAGGHRRQVRRGSPSQSSAIERGPASGAPVHALAKPCASESRRTSRCGTSVSPRPNSRAHWFGPSRLNAPLVRQMLCDPG